MTEVPIDPMDGKYPPLLIISKANLRPDVIAIIKETVRASQQDGKPMLFDAGMSVFQFINGKYEPLVAKEQQ